MAIKLGGIIRVKPLKIMIVTLLKISSKE